VTVPTQWTLWAPVSKTSLITRWTDEQHIRLLELGHGVRLASVTGQPTSPPHRLIGLPILRGVGQRLIMPDWLVITVAQAAAIGVDVSLTVVGYFAGVARPIVRPQAGLSFRRK